MTQKEQYLKAWRGIFLDLLGWPTERTDEWIARAGFFASLDDPHSILYHSTPQYWTVAAIIEYRLPGVLSESDWQDLADELLDVLQPGKTQLPPPDTDWSQYKPEVDRLIRDHDPRQPSAVEADATKRESQSWSNTSAKGVWFGDRFSVSLPGQTLVPRFTGA
jgi:hypothetical protein